MRRKLGPVSFLLLLCFFASGLRAQLPPAKPDVLGKASVQTSVGCSATESSCAEAAAKILPQVLGPSPLEENLRRLTDDVGGGGTRSSAKAKAGEWAVAALRADGMERRPTKEPLPG